VLARGSDLWEKNKERGEKRGRVKIGGEKRVEERRD